MDLIKYQFSEPDQICSLDDQVFELLLHQKIYQVNPKFANNQQCVLRLINFLKTMETSLKNLKLIKNLINKFQSPIFFFLKDFYQKSHLTFTDAFVKNDSDTQSIQKKKSKCQALLLWISAQYNSLTENVGKIQEFDFLTKYGRSVKNAMLQKSETELKYLKFLKILLAKQIIMKDPNIKSGSKFSQLTKLKTEFQRIMRDSQSCVLEQLTFSQIHAKYHSLANSTPDNSLTIPKNLSSSIQVSKKYLPKTYRPSQNDLETVKNIIPCCRTFFYQNQPIQHPESFTLEYKNYIFPYDNFCTKNLRKAICGFLNREGGIILVGIQERKDKSKQVKGQYFSQNQKQQAMKEYRHICSEIYPDIIAQSKYKIKFVPIKSINRKFIPGKYIVRVQVSHGDQTNLYTYKQNKEEFVAIRTANQVLKRYVDQETLLRFRQRLQNPIKINPIHEVQCPEPEMGQLIWKDGLNSKKNRKNKRQYRDNNSDSNSSEHEKETKKNNWTQTMEHSPFYRKPKKQSDFVYFSQKNEPSQKQYEKGEKSFSKFICDDDEDDIKKKKSKEQQEKVVQENQKGNIIDQSLDFQPLNPILPRKNSKAQPSKTPIQYISKENCIKIQQPNKTDSVGYKLQRVSSTGESNQKSIKEVKSVEILIAGYPFELVKEQIKKHGVVLVQEPIKCYNDFITLLQLKLYPADPSIATNYENFTKSIMKKHTEMNVDYKFKIRRVFQNLFFSDQAFLNRLIHKYRHNQEFTDKSGHIYYSFRNNIEAIQAYVMGWELKVSMKFISSSDLKKTKLDYLRQKAERNL